MLRFVTTGMPDIAETWPRFEPGKEPLAILSQPLHIVPLNEGARFRVWAEFGLSTNDKKNIREAR